MNCTGVAHKPWSALEYPAELDQICTLGPQPQGYDSVWGGGGGGVDGAAFLLHSQMTLRLLVPRSHFE